MASVVAGMATSEKSGTAIDTMRTSTCSRFMGDLLSLALY